MDDSPPLFARPELRPTGALEGIISPGNMRGVKMKSNLSIPDCDAIWTEVVQQVARQGCGLGYFASPPPLLERPAAESAVEQAPMPFSG